jgi:outer membrane lipopolysaccharide assembly protein LptE/RlpB
MWNAECGMRNLNALQLLLNLFTKILRTPNSELRTCSRLFSIICVALLLGCGYKMVGRETHIPPGITSIAIATFVNQTLERRIEVPFTQGFLREFIFGRKIRVVDLSEADSILEGTIKSFNISSVSYDRSGFVLEYQTSVVIDLTLRKKTGEIIWTVKDLSDNRFYRTSSNTLISEANKATAIQQAGRFVAERIRNRFFYNF